MGDFYQNGLVTTLHNFRERPYDELEKKLIHFSKKRPISRLQSLGIRIVLVTSGTV
ncbi:hypothetical protein ES703_116620 [subsurface metagenome]